MKAVLYIGCVGLVITAGLCGPVLGGDTFEYTGAGNRNWTSSGNWQGASGYPGQGGVTDDIVIIPDGLDEEKYPCKFDATTITIKRLAVAGDRDNDPIDLKFLSDGDAHTLILDPEQGGGSLGPGEAAIDLGANAAIEVNPNGTLKLKGFAVIRGYGGSEAVIKFLGTENDKPRFIIGDGGIVSVEGAVDIYATGPGIDLTGEVGDPSDHPEIFVLGASCRMLGSFVIDPIMYQHGNMYTSADDPNGEPDAPGKIMFNCHPKAGGGYYAGAIEVNGGSVGSRSELVINAPFAGSANLIIGKFGTMHVHRHFVMLRETDTDDGDLHIHRGGEIRVDKGTLFEIVKVLMPPNDCTPTIEPD